MSVVSTQFAGRVTLLRDKVESFDRYPFSLPAIRALEFLDLHPKITFLVGENGSGKSTLLEAMAVALGFNPEGGSRNFNFDTRESHSELHRYLRIAKGYRRHRGGFFPRAESWFNLATEIEKLDAEFSFSPPVIRWRPDRGRRRRRTVHASGAAVNRLDLFRVCSLHAS
jgi:predicted ATPase